MVKSGRQFQFSPRLTVFFILSLSVVSCAKSDGTAVPGNQSAPAPRSDQSAPNTPSAAPPSIDNASNTGNDQAVPGDEMADSKGQPNPNTHSYISPTAQVYRARGKPSWNPAWDSYVEDALSPMMTSSHVPADVKLACPKFFTLSTQQMKTFWAYFFQCVAVAESDLNRMNRFRETGIPARDAVTHLPIWSEGLLQLSYGDNAIHGCNFDWAHDRALGPLNPAKTIFDAKHNLECGVKILHNQLFGSVPHPVFPTRNYYWSTLTRRSDRNSGFHTVMTEMAGVPAFCK